MVARATSSPTTSAYEEDGVLLRRDDDAGDDLLGSHGGEADMPPPPSIVDIKRLAKVKAEHDGRLLKLRARVDRLNAQERKVWKDVAWTQQMSMQAQEAQWRRQAEQADRMRLEREVVAQEQNLRERARDQRQRMVQTKDAPRQQKFLENKSLGRMVREDSKRYMDALSGVRDHTLRGKATQVEIRRQQIKQMKLQRELEATRREHERQEENALKYIELQEEIQNSELAIAVAERGEMGAVQRLQNSQSIRAEVLNQFQLSSVGGADENGTPTSDGQPDFYPPSPPTSSSFNGPATSRGSRSSPGLLLAQPTRPSSVPTQPPHFAPAPRGGGRAAPNAPPQRSPRTGVDWSSRTRGPGAAAMDTSNGWPLTNSRAGGANAFLGQITEEQPSPKQSVPARPGAAHQAADASAPSTTLWQKLGSLGSPRTVQSQPQLGNRPG